MIAAVILVLAMIPLWGLMGSSHKQAMTSADELRVAQLASEVLEQIEIGSYSVADNSTIDLNPEGHFDDDGNVKNSPFPSYLKNPGGLECRYKESDTIRYVTITYKEPDGKMRRYTLSGYIDKK